MSGFCLLHLLRPGRAIAGSAFRWGETHSCFNPPLHDKRLWWALIHTKVWSSAGENWQSSSKFLEIKNLEKSLKPQQLLGLAQYSTACNNTAAWSWDDTDGLIFFCDLLGCFSFSVRVKILRRELCSCSLGGTGLGGFVFLWKLIAEGYPTFRSGAIICGAVQQEPEFKNKIPGCLPEDPDIANTHAHTYAGPRLATVVSVTEPRAADNENQKGSLVPQKERGRNTRLFVASHASFWCAQEAPQQQKVEGQTSAKSFLVMFAVGPSLPCLLSPTFSLPYCVRGSELSSPFLRMCFFLKIEKQWLLCHAECWVTRTANTFRRKEGPTILASEPCCSRVYLLDCRNSRWSDHLSRRSGGIQRR